MRIPRTEGWLIVGYLGLGMSRCRLLAIPEPNGLSLEHEVEALPLDLGGYCQAEVGPSTYWVRLDFDDAAVHVGAGETWADAWDDLSSKWGWTRPGPTSPPGKVGPGAPALKAPIALPPAQA